MWQSKKKKFKDSTERNCNARIQNCLEKAVYKCIQTENKRVKINLNFSTKVNQKSKKYHNQEQDKAGENLTSFTIQH